jgi:hypothetical protein
MAETSFPIVGADLTDDAWAATVGAVGNGVLDDWGSPYAMTVNTDDTVTILPSSTGYARAVVNGFGHQLDAGKTVSVPAVATTTTYQIGLLYDPTNAALPVSIVVLKGANPALTTGQEFLPLHVFVRASGQTLSAASKYSPIPRIRPQLLVSSTNALRTMWPKLFLFGTEVLCTDTNVTYRAAGTSAAPQWVADSSQGTWQGTRAAVSVTRGNRVAVPAFTNTVDRNGWWMNMAAGAFKLEDGHYVITASMRFSSVAGRGDGRAFIDIAPAAASGQALARAALPEDDTLVTVTWNGFVSAASPLAIWIYRQLTTSDRPTVTLSVTRIA